MKNRTGEFKLSADQKLRLMNLGLNSEIDDTIGDDNAAKAERLYEVLTSSLPVEPDVVDSLPPILRNMSRKMTSVAGQRVSHYLLSPKTHVDIFRKIKDFARQSGESTDSEIHRDVFLAVYCMAIASALFFHNQKISRHTDEDLKGFFAKYAAQTWIPPEIALIFREAGGHLHQSCKSKE